MSPNWRVEENMYFVFHEERPEINVIYVENTKNIH
jgi:hypothetical protein